MKLIDYTTTAGLLPRLQCQSLEEVVTRLVASLAATGTVNDREQLISDVLARERETATAIGGGLAIPHARSAAVTRLQMAVATLAEPLDLSAEDQRPVDLVVLIVGPLHLQRQMLQLLARLARLVKDTSFLAALRRAEDAATMARILSGPD
jgi:PTS system fructose-specific IIC component